MLTASHTVSDAHTLTLLFDEAISKGLVVKKLESRYEAGARNFTWIKLRIGSPSILVIQTHQQNALETFIPSSSDFLMYVNSSAIPESPKSTESHGS
jgi:hypothetical protein